MERRNEPAEGGWERQGRFTRDGESDFADERGATRTRVQPDAPAAGHDQEPAQDQAVTREQGRTHDENPTHGQGLTHERDLAREEGRTHERDLAREEGRTHEEGPTHEPHDREHDHGHDGHAHAPAAGAATAAGPTAHGAHGVAADTMRDIRARQRDEFGGFNIGAAFFGWLVAFGMAALLTGLLSAAGAATGLTESADQETVGLAGGIALLIASAIAYYCGGYVAGRMSRFDGGRQGAGVWIIGLLVAIALGALAYAAGAEYNVLDRANLPRLTVGEDAATAGIVAMAVMLAATLLAAILGGKAGQRYHTKIDRHVVDGH